VFVDNLLSKLNHEYPTHDTPSPGIWKLMINDVEQDLNKWDPQNLKPDAPILIVPRIEKSLVPITTTPTTQKGNEWAWAYEMRSFRLPADVVFELEGDSHLLLVLRCQTKYRVSNRRTKIIETIHRILVPADYAVAEVLKLVRARTVSGVFEEPSPNDLRNDNRSASELGWKHGTILRLELW
jgi:hypothetical protein